ncbi:MAG: signal peptidase I [Desulfosporosinus sp.]|nr:signal peptidase I [Desulfosporosinus sp.]
MKKTLRRVVNITLTLFLAMMVIVVFFTVTSKFSKDGTSKLGKYQMMEVLSGSMSPVFNAGDVVVVDANGKPLYNTGDVITFKDPQDLKRVITHRVIEVLQQEKQISYRTKGDANNTDDLKPVPAANIIGQEKFRIPYLGWVLEFAKTKLGVVLLVIIPGILMIIDEFRKIYRAMAEDIEKKKQDMTSPSSDIK